MITKHKSLSAEFLENNYDHFFGAYQQLLLSDNYVVRRQSLKLLGELLLDRHNFNVMTRYISNPDNLKLMMNILKEKSRNIQFEAFHVFKVYFNFFLNKFLNLRFLLQILINQNRLQKFFFEIGKNLSNFCPIFIQNERMMSSLTMKKHI